MLIDPARGNTVSIDAPLTAPLRPLAEFSKASILRANRHGVLVYIPDRVDGVLKQRLALLSHDLCETRWVVAGTSSTVDAGDSLWLGPLDRTVREIDWKTGEEKRRFAAPDHPIGAVSGMVGDTLLLNYFYTVGFVAVDTRGNVLWRRPWDSGLPVSTRDTYLFPEHFGRRLIAVDALSGQERWRREIVPDSVGHEDAVRRSLLAGYPSVSSVGERLVLVRGFQGVTALSPTTGETLAEAVSPLGGHYLVTDRHVLFFSDSGLLTFDHHAMSEAARLDLSGDIASLYGREQATIRGFTLSRNAVFWTAPEGVLMGVNALPGADGVRRTWRAKVEGLSPISRGPIVYDHYLYWCTEVVRPAEPSIVVFSETEQT